MIGFLIGTACLIGLVKTLRGGCGYGRGYGGCGGQGGHGGGCGRSWGGHGGGCGSGWGGGWHGGWRGHGGWGGHGGWHGHDEAHEGSREAGAEGGERGWGGRGFWRGGMLRFVFERLDTTPGQEKVIKSVMEDLKTHGEGLREEWKRARGEVATALRAEVLDEAALRASSARMEAASQSMRDAVISAVTQVHQVLEPEQRKRLADLMDRAGGMFGRRGGHGPYRGLRGGMKGPRPCDDPS